MPSQIVRPEPNSNFFTGFFDHCSGGFVRNGEDSWIRLNVVFPDVGFKPVCHFLRNENVLTPFSAFWASERQLSAPHISGCQFQTSPSMGAIVVDNFDKE